MPSTKTQLNPQMIDDVVRRIVSIAHPLSIILFGSAARGEMSPDSDIDVMVVMPDGTHRLNTLRLIYKQMRGLGLPIDLIVATPRVLEQHKDNIGLIYRTVLDEGKEVYAV